MAKQTQMSSGQVLDVLRAKHFEGSAYAFLREVRNATGFDKQERRADAMAISCWPSRGIYFAGIEVKVSRADWRTELRNPAKSAEIQQYCAYWWIATPEGVIEPGELPETWGHIVVGKNSRVVAKEAPRLAPKDPDVAFVASVLRNFARMETHLKEEYERGKREALNGEPEPEIEALQSALAVQKVNQGYLEQQYQKLQENVRAVEAATGLTIEHSWYLRDDNARVLKAAKALLNLDAALISSRLRDAAELLSKVPQLAAEAKDGGRA